nr:MAG TPA: hypothetical protein [Caudoviricetes sp.]
MKHLFVISECKDTELFSARQISELDFFLINYVLTHHSLPLTDDN